MGKGLVSNQTLCDIANAIRTQAGTYNSIKPDGLPDAVEALNGSQLYSSHGETTINTEAKGYVNRSALQGVADAIRGHNGESTLYKPGDMAQAILDLTWPTLQALLLDDGTMVLGRFKSYTPPAGTSVTATYTDVPRYSAGSASGLPWYEERAQVTRVVIDESIASAGIGSCYSWFSGMTNLVEVEGLEHLSGITNTKYMFSGCTALETIWCDGTFDASVITQSDSMFGDCNRLVGGDGATLATVCSAVGGAAVISTVARALVGGTGLLTAHGADARVWLYGYCYEGDSGNELVVTTSSTPDAGKTLVAQTHFSASGRYVNDSPMPGGRSADGCSMADYVSAEVDASVGTTSCAEMHIDTWFSGCTGLTSITGLCNIHDLVTMRSAFSRCSALTELSLSGISSAKLVGCDYAFYYSSKLTTIYADEGFASNPDYVDSNTFYSCGSLRGGAGTTYYKAGSSSVYLRIDGGTDAPGLLTLTPSEP